MALNDLEYKEFLRRLLLSRMRILNHHPFFGLLLMHMGYGIDEDAPTAYTDGERIMFGKAFIKELSDSELDTVMMHEILHVVLGHCWRGENVTDHERFNIACDIVINSNILLENHMNIASITVSSAGGALMHVAPDGKEGFEYTAEEVYRMLPSKPNRRKSSSLSKSQFDDHSQWDQAKDPVLKEEWEKRIHDAVASIKVREQVYGVGLLPAFAKRLLGELHESNVDWRMLLNDFVQQEVNDYSFSPPDKRMIETDFFLPDFNVAEDRVQNILFMVDTSGSVTDQMMTAAFSEVKGAVEQFSGALEGWLGFFDAAVIEPKPFSAVEELVRIQPEGGGGTSFHVIFEYVAKFMADEPPACIIILTDGYADFPLEAAANEIPVLWLICDSFVVPPWGIHSRMDSH